MGFTKWHHDINDFVLDEETISSLRSKLESHEYTAESG
jgi:hypothetical protein